ncbi:hypothetical protein TEA_011874 [Camellia sinensis var. sinensis]|uniref:Uncharacterized protein n=1 Tax=Camellia sinensis var. sinensis TaxID=542762 RepID=A0A4S4DXD3_CAMSN|nr:hypothetical protein TEA_011874 [Camellia sinensis var. sinensis]
MASAIPPTNSPEKLPPLASWNHRFTQSDTIVDSGVVRWFSLSPLVLDEEEEKVWKENLLLQSLRGPVPSFGPNPPTYIPASSTKANTISQKTFVGHAMPPPEEEERMKNKNLLLQSLRGPVPPLGPNPGTYIPTSNSKINTISQKSFAGHAIPPPAYPRLRVPFGVAKS